MLQQQADMSVYRLKLLRKLETTRTTCLREKLHLISSAMKTEVYVNNTADGEIM